MYVLFRKHQKRPVMLHEEFDFVWTILTFTYLILKNLNVIFITDYWLNKELLLLEWNVQKH